MHVQTHQIAIHIYEAEAHSSLVLQVIFISAAKMGEKKKCSQPLFISINFS